MVDVGVALTSLTSSMFELHGRHGQRRCGADKKRRVGRLLVHRLFITIVVVIALVPQLFGSFLLSVGAIFHQEGNS